MFLFKKKSGTNDAQSEYILHTGDFRSEKEILACPQLQSVSISQLFLDTTYAYIYIYCFVCHHIVSLSCRLVMSLSYSRGREH